METGESTLIVITIVGMVVSIIVSIIPFVPGPALVWAIGIIFALLTSFERATPIAVVLMTLLMIAGSTTEFWMPMLGINSRGMSCLSVIGSFAGSLLGTIFIPIPILGTIIGAILGAVVIEFVKVGEFKKAINAGRATFELYLIGFVVELIVSLLILAVFVVSVWSTG